MSARLQCGGEEGIRTLDALLTHTPLAGERLQPLGHLSLSRCSKSGLRLQSRAPRQLFP